MVKVNSMTDLEYDLTMSIEWMPTQWEDSEAEVDCEETANNLTKLGYQKIIWHKVSEGDFPQSGLRVLGYFVENNKWFYDFFYYDFPIKKKFVIINILGNMQEINPVAWMEIPEYKE